MGVPGLFSWIRKTYRQAISDKPIGNIDRLVIDMSSLLHNAAADALSYGEHENVARQQELSKRSYEELRDLVITRALRKIRSLLQMNEVSYQLIIAYDGSTSFAKMNQQRERRFPPSTTHIQNWSTDYISVATDFMNSVQNKVLEAIGNNTFQVQDVIVSPYNAPGEGEHKIFQILTALSNQGRLGRTLIHGLDADILLLTMSRGMSDIFVQQERERSTSYIQASRIASLLENDYWHEASANFFNDFIAMTCFVGNDFIPPLLEASHLDVGDVLTSLLDIYNKQRLSLTNSEGIINLENIKALLRTYTEGKPMEAAIAVSQYQYEVMPDGALNGMTYPPVFAETEDDESAFHTEYNDRMILLRNVRDRTFSILSREVSQSQAKRKASQIIRAIQEERQEEIDNAVLSYLNMVSWVVRLYSQGVLSVNAEFTYYYPLAPLVSDLLNADVPDDELITEENDWLPSAMQLKLILPHSSSIPPVDFRPLASTTVTQYLYPKGDSLQYLPDLKPLYGKYRPLLPTPIPEAVKDAASKVVRVYDSKTNVIKQNTMQYSLRSGGGGGMRTRMKKAGPTQPYSQKVSGGETATVSKGVTRTRGGSQRGVASRGRVSKAGSQRGGAQQGATRGSSSRGRVSRGRGRARGRGRGRGRGK